MSYLGNTPAARFTSMDKQTITGDGTVGPYTLDYAVGSEQEVEVFVNNVRQEPSVAYTVSGTDLTMTGTVASTDDFYVVFQGKAQQTATHPSNSALQATTGTFSGALSATTGTFSGALSATTGTFSGAVSMGSNNISFSDGNGIDFSASAGSGASSSILDDYEQGTWTASLTATTTNPTTSSVGNTTGYYVKIGDIVNFSYYSGLVAFTSAGSGTATLSGLPFTSSSGFQEYWLTVYMHGTAFAQSCHGGYAPPNSTFIQFIQSNSITGANWVASGNGYLMVTGTYRSA